jgi:hypothetical protein
MIFLDLITTKKIGEGYLENNLYFLDSNKTSFNSMKDENLSEL